MWDAFSPFFGGVLAWFIRALIWLAAFLGCAGCSLSAAWAAPHQAQTSGQGATVQQSGPNENPQVVGPPTSSPSSSLLSP